MPGLLFLGEYLKESLFTLRCDIRQHRREWLKADALVHSPGALVGGAQAYDFVAIRIGRGYHV